MGILRKIILRNFKLNKKRMVVTIIGIMLSVALLNTVLTLLFSYKQSVIDYEISEKGNFHLAIYNIEKSEVDFYKNNRYIEKIYLSNIEGYAKLKDSKNNNKPYACVVGFSKEFMNNAGIRLMEGRMPKEEGEIVIPNHLETTGRVFYNVGDSIELNIGKRVNELGEELVQYDGYEKDNSEKIIDSKKKKYKIVGVIESPNVNIENTNSPGFSFITYVSDDELNNESKRVNAFVRFNKKGLSEKDDKNVYSILEDSKKGSSYQWTENVRLREFESSFFEGHDSIVIYAKDLSIIVIVIIVLASILCIRNSVEISVTEKIKQYGMLISVGATKKQIKKSVLMESFMLGSMGISLGLVVGWFVSFGLKIVCNVFLLRIFHNTENAFKINICFSWIAFLLAILLSMLVILLSSLKAIYLATKITPIDAIINSSNVKIKSKKIKCPRFIFKLFGIGGVISYKNVKRNKRKLRTTVVSIVTSTVVFIVVYYILTNAYILGNDMVNKVGYDLSLQVYSEKSSSKIKEKAYATVKNDLVSDYAIIRKKNMFLVNPKYTDEYNTIIKNENGLKNDDQLGYRDDFEEDMDVINVVSLGDYQHKKYLEMINLDYNEYKDKAIFVIHNNRGTSDVDSSGQSLDYYVKKYNYFKDDNIELVGKDDTEKKQLAISFITDKVPFAMTQYSEMIVVSEKMYKNIMPNEDSFTIYYTTKNPNELQSTIEKEMVDEKINLYNEHEGFNKTRSIIILIAIFLYGLIIVISLIGITNITNIITTNMFLRKKEFAMLRSVGMKEKEFKKMIRLESVFIGGRALIIAVPLGLLLSYVSYVYLKRTILFSYRVPWGAVGICVIVVYILVLVLMMYSMNKINKENIIDTIRNDNI